MSKQNYVSHELYHFVGRHEASDDLRYALLVKIIRDGWITFPPHDHDATATSTEINFEYSFTTDKLINPKVICFCDIPFSELDIHMKKYSRFGISFSRKYLVCKGARPVLYIPVDGIEDGITEAEYFEKNIKNLTKIQCMLFLDTVKENGVYSLDDLKDPERIWKTETSEFIRILLSCLKGFNSSLPEDDPDNYYMEREWRMLHNLNFSLSDINRVILPFDYCERFKLDVPKYKGEIKCL